MNPLYNSRQRRIYNDYISWSTEKLIDILKNRDNYNSDIIGVISEILKERNVSLPGSFTPSADTFIKEKPVSEKEYTEAEKKRTAKEGKKRKFITDLHEKPQEEITGIITRYSYYEPDKIEATLSVAADRGIISYDLMKSLQKQMTENLGQHWNRKANFSWEKENAFMGFVSRYSDDEIYEIIDNPKEMVIDVYHAVLLTALNRELISYDDFKAFFKGARSALTTDFERSMDDFRERFDLPGEDEDPLSDEAVRTEAAKYRKCPACGELVDAEYTVCWKCQAEIPESAPLPQPEEMKREMISEHKGLAMHPLLIVILVAIFIFGASAARDWIVHGDVFHHKYSLTGLGIFLAGGVIWFIFKYIRIMKD